MVQLIGEPIRRASNAHPKQSSNFLTKLSLFCKSWNCHVTVRLIIPASSANGSNSYLWPVTVTRLGNADNGTRPGLFSRQKPLFAQLRFDGATLRFFRVN